MSQPQTASRTVNPFCTPYPCDQTDELSPSRLRMDSFDVDPHLTHGSLDPRESVSQTACRSVQPFLLSSPFHLNLQNSMLYNAFQLAGQHSNLSLPVARSRLHLIHGTWAYRVTRPNGISIGSAVFCELTNVTNKHTYRRTRRQTDRQTTLLRL